MEESFKNCIFLFRHIVVGWFETFKCDKYYKKRKLKKVLNSKKVHHTVMIEIHRYCVFGFGKRTAKA